VPHPPDPMSGTAVRVVVDEVMFAGLVLTFITANSASVRRACVPASSRLRLSGPSGGRSGLNEQGDRFGACACAGLKRRPLLRLEHSSRRESLLGRRPSRPQKSFPYDPNASIPLAITSHWLDRVDSRCLAVTGACYLVSGFLRRADRRGQSFRHDPSMGIYSTIRPTSAATSTTTSLPSPVAAVSTRTGCGGWRATRSTRRSSITHANANCSPDRHRSGGHRPGHDHPIGMSSS